MLSQRIAMLAADVVRDPAPQTARRLSNAIELFHNSHESIASGETGHGITSLPDTVRSVLFEPPQSLDRQVEQYVSLARKVAALDEDSDVALTELIAMAAPSADHPNGLLAGLNDVVSGFQMKHETQIAQMKWVQNLALVVLVFALALEAVLIFRPMVSRINRLADSLGKASITDPMTQINNRRGFMLRGETLVAQRQQGALLLLDIDHFKKVNDQYGHAAGDACIVHLAKIANDMFRTGDVFGRIGGEEFAVVLQGVTHASSLMVAERLRHLIESTPCDVTAVKCAVDTIPLTISIGVCWYEHPRPLDELLHDADAALYEAKRNGRNQVKSTDTLDTMTFRVIESAPGGARA